MLSCCTIDNIISKFDIYAQPYYLKVRGKDKLGTGAGLILTFITMSIGIGAFIYQLDQLYQTKNPNITVSQRKYQGGRSYEIPKNTFQHAIGVVDENLNPIVNTIAKTYYEVFYDICNESSCERITSSRCSDEFIQFHADEFGTDPNMFKYTSCMNQTYYENNPIQLEGGTFSLNYKRLNIVVERCINRTNSDYLCASTKEQDEKLKNSVIIYGLQDFEFQPDDYLNPFKESYFMTIQFVKLNEPKESLVSYQVSTVISETNFYFFFPQQQKQVNLELLSTILDRNIDIENTIGRIVIMLHENGITRTRTYQNIFNLLGTLGGFMDIIMIICKVLIIPFNWVEQRLLLINFVNKTDLSIINLAKSRSSRKRFNSNINQLMKHLEVSYLLYFMQEGSQRLMLTESLNPNHNQNPSMSQWNNLISNVALRTSQKNQNTTKRAETFSDIPDEAEYDRNRIILQPKSRIDIQT